MRRRAVPATPLAGDWSLYLDLLRGAAAILVVLDHAQNLFPLQGLPRLGHQGVVLFFILSGYVICNTVDSRATSFQGFMVARLARLWSVLVPALLLTILCDSLGRQFGINPVYEAVNNNLPVIRIGSALLFLSDSWASIQPFSNSVVWSLSAEFWYYVIFASAVLLRGRLRLALLGVALLLAGFKALLLLPVWLMGVALQRWQAPRGIGPMACLACALGGAGLAGWIWGSGQYDAVYAAMRATVGPWVFLHLEQAKYFPLDWIFGLAITVHLLGMRGLSRFLPLRHFAAPIRFIANLSFATYLFHTPVLYLCAAFLPADQGVTVLAITAVAILVLGWPAERSKGWWRQRLERRPAMPPAEREAASAV